MNLIEDLLPKKVITVLNVALDAVFLALMGYMFKISLDYLAKVARYGTLSVGLKIPMWIVYLILPLFSALTALRLVEKYVRKLTENKRENKEGGK